MNTMQEEESSPSTDSIAGWTRTERLILLLQLLLAVLLVLIPAVIVEQRMFLLKVGVVVLLSGFPGWLYVQFLKLKSHSVYDEFVLNLFRLRIDKVANLPMPPKHTTYYKEWKSQHEQLRSTSKDNLYRKKFEAVYGPAAVSTYSSIHENRPRPRLSERTETFGPVLVATVFFAAGWTLVLEPELLRAFSVPRLQLSGRPIFPGDALRFGFIGAYAFTLQDILRRYYRDDLKGIAYISAASRLVFSALVVSAAHLMWNSFPQESASAANTEMYASREALAAFVIGFFPLVGLQAIQATVAKLFGWVIPSVRTDYPLSELEGLNVWYEARLSEEGIDDMQNLASANLVDLMLRTRQPVHRIVDWVDQACLYLHVPGAPGRLPSLPRRMARGLKGAIRSTSDQSQAESAGVRDSLPALKLRKLGIRTATDLQRVARCLNEDAKFVEQFNLALGLDKEVGPAALRAVLAGLDGEVNLFHVSQFRAVEWLAEEVITPADGEDPSEAVSEPVELSPAHQSESPAQPLEPSLRRRPFGWRRRLTLGW